MSVVVGYVMRILGEAYIEWIAVVAAVTATDVLGNLFFILFNQCILLFFFKFSCCDFNSNLNIVIVTRIIDKNHNSENNNNKKI